MNARGRGGRGGRGINNQPLVSRERASGLSGMGCRCNDDNLEGTMRVVQPGAAGAVFGSEDGGGASEAQQSSSLPRPATCGLGNGALSVQTALPLQRDNLSGLVCSGIVGESVADEGADGCRVAPESSCERSREVV